MEILWILLGLLGVFGAAAAGSDGEDAEEIPSPAAEPIVHHSPLDDPEFEDLREEDFDGVIREGTEADDMLVGGPGNDLLIGNGGDDHMIGGNGDDHIWAMEAEGLTGLYGGPGNDTIKSSVPGYGQIHIGAREGDDRIIVDLTNYHGLQGHHIYTGIGEDRIEFENSDQIYSPVLGRIDDFDPSRDVLLLDGQELDLQDLPDGVDVVLYLDQQWLRIEDKALYALEGARDGGDERHFSPWPEDVSALPVVDYTPSQNHVPADVFDAPAEGMDPLWVEAPALTGTDEAEWIVDIKVNRHDEHGEHDDPMIQEAGSFIDAGGGDDVVDAGKGDDHVLGGAGNDYRHCPQGRPVARPSRTAGDNCES